MTSKANQQFGSKLRKAESSASVSQSPENVRFDQQHSLAQESNARIDLESELCELQQEVERLRKQLDQTEQTLAKQAQQLELLQSEARTDALTGLLNRRAFDEALIRTVSAWRRRACPFSLVILDVDDFKLVNDQYGHAVGDDLLQQLASLLTRSLRDMDLLARIGGEEFAVVLPVTNASEAVVPAERLRQAVASRKFEIQGQNLAVTISAGSTSVQPNDDVASVIRRADAALYAAKASGRNIVWSAELGRIEPTSSVR